MDECFDAVMTLKSNKVAGCDGITVEVYRKFWSLLKDPLFEVYKESLKCGFLNQSARKGVITLIPKKSKDDTYVEHWRPLTILNYDFKILAKLIANRLELVAGSIVGEQQTGFLKGRYLGTNIMKTMEIVAHLKRENKPGIVAMVDFAKCFDKVEYDSIDGAFAYFGFGNYFRRMIQVLFRKFQVCTQNNGHTSEFQDKTRGVNQGCPASPLVYVICSEVLSHVVKENTDIRGINIHNIEEVLSQFADDTGAYLKYEEEAIEGFCSSLSCIEANLGLTVSYEKTVLYRVGSLHNSNARIYTTKNLKWSDGPIDTLGVKINGDGTMAQENFEEIMVKVNSVCNSWNNRLLTLMGKVLLINCLIGSLFVYKMLTVMTLSQVQLEQINGIIHKFLWKGKRARIAMSTLTKKKNQGGLKLVDLVAKQNALKISWIFKLNQSPFLQAAMYENLTSSLGMSLWKCNLSQTDAMKIFKASLWGDIMAAWCLINYRKPSNRLEVLDQVLWLNSDLRINNRPVCWTSWIQCGILTVKDICTDNNAFINFAELNLEPRCSWLEYESIKAAFPMSWRIYLNDNEELSEPNHSGYLYDQIAKGTNCTSAVYNMLIEDKNMLRKYYERWCNSNSNFAFVYDDFCKWFNNIYGITKITKYRDFQYRLLLGKIVLNSELYEWGKVTSPLCSFCKDREENFSHFFLECTTTREIWDRLNIWSKGEIRIDCIETIIANNVNEVVNHISNFVCLIVKQYLYSCRCTGKTPTYQGCVATIEKHYEIDRFESKEKNCQLKHRKRWDPLFLS